ILQHFLNPPFILYFVFDVACLLVLWATISSLILHLRISPSLIRLTSGRFPNRISDGSQNAAKNKESQEGTDRAPKHIVLLGKVYHDNIAGLPCFQPADS